MLIPGKVIQALSGKAGVIVKRRDPLWIVLLDDPVVATPANFYDFATNSAAREGWACKRQSLMQEISPLDRILETLDTE